MAGAFIDNPVLNSPFRMPDRYYERDVAGNPTGKRNQGRRRSLYLVPVPPLRQQDFLGRLCNARTRY